MKLEVFYLTWLVVRKNIFMGEFKFCGLPNVPKCTIILYFQLLKVSKYTVSQIRVCIKSHVSLKDT